MRILVTGACGFVGFSLIKHAAEQNLGWQVVGIDNLSRPGSETRRRALAQYGAQFHHGDVRNATDIDDLPKVDWVIDAAAQPSVIAGLTGNAGSRQLVEHNLGGTINLLEFCKARSAGFLLLSTSRVYSIPPLANLPVQVNDSTLGYELDATQPLPDGVTEHGISETFSTQAPVSLYGSTKLCSEALALEYGQTFGFPVWINRCGVLAGSGQFGHAAQGIFSFWLHSWFHKRPLKYIGFDGRGHQVRDALHPADLLPVLKQQLATTDHSDPMADRIFNLAGGQSHAMSLRALSKWCEDRLGPHTVGTDMTPRPFDLPWVVLDSSKAESRWGFRPRLTLDHILDEIATDAQSHPDWLDLATGR